MKKLIAILLVAAMALAMTACGAINDTEVSVLWSGDGVVKIPNSLINAMERAMYIESISYKHYGAGGDQAVQTKQAEDALNAGCAALAVELVDVSAAQTILDLAKAKNVPVVFFNCEVDDAVASGYDKCVVVGTDVASVGAVQGKMIGQYVTESFDKLDRNKDGQLSYTPFGTVDVSAVNEALTAAGKPALVPVVPQEPVPMSQILKSNNEEGGNMVELVITDSDVTALEVLADLQAVGFNDTRLTTHCIPLFTVGAAADASAFTDTSALKEEELAVFIYNAMNLIDAGKLAGTAMEDYDSIAIAVATVLRNLLKGNDTTKDIAETAVASPRKVSIAYTTYTG